MGAQVSFGVRLKHPRKSKNVDGKGLLDRCWPVKSQVVTGMLVNLKVAETSTWCIGARSLQEHWASLEAQFGGFN